MQLEPKEAIIVFIRRDETKPSRYMVGIRKAETGFHHGRNDLEVGARQKSLSELGEFNDLAQAVNAASEKLKGLTSKAASMGRTF